MYPFVTVLLLLVLGVLSVKLWNHRQALRRLHRAIFSRQPLLREDLPGASGREWDELCDQTNELIHEVNRLHQQRTGQLAQLEATLGSLQEAVLIVDSSNFILLANKALQEIFPRALNILGQRLELVLHSVEFLNYVDAVRKNQASPQHEIEFVEADRTTWVELTGATIPSLDAARGSWVLFVLHDITKQKKLELVRKEFVANVSHELRTPLSVIKGYVETLVDGHREIQIDDRERFLKTIQRHTDRLNSLLEDLLTLSRLESINPGLKHEAVLLVDLVKGIVDDYRSRPGAADHRLNFEAEPAIGSVLIDPLKVTQVLGNLLDNALKYTPKGSRLEVLLSLRSSDVEVCVRDDGPGIPAEDLPHIFERFYRVDKGRSREKGGTGLGLSIVKHIVQLHGGRVWVESVVGRGSAFYFTLPVRK
ncbi:MAG: PAS domain S-box protein [Opitutaceae bacterium]|nr:PAS domain S-box protein [Opitutaceae bacterium]